MNGLRLATHGLHSSVLINTRTMAIHWSLDRLEGILPPQVYSEMAKASCNPSIAIEAGGKYPIIHGETGKLLAGVPYAKGLRVPRSKMRALCGEGITVEVWWLVRGYLAHADLHSTGKASSKLSPTPTLSPLSSLMASVLRVRSWWAPMGLVRKCENSYSVRSKSLP
jgi:hypothetical protein